MILDVIKQIKERQIRNNWYENYWAFDLHGTIIKPNHVRGNTDLVYFPYAKEVMQILVTRPDIRTICFTSSYPEEIEEYNNKLMSDNICFTYVNENPEIRSYDDFGYYEKKFYFDILFEDKAGFDPNVEWKMILNFLVNDNWRPDELWKNPKRTPNYFPPAWLKRHEINLDI